MADVIIPVPTGTTQSGKKWFKGLFITLLILVAVFFTIVALHNKHLKDMGGLIDKASKEYEDEAQANKYITDACSEVLSNPFERREAKKFAKDAKISFEQAVLDIALGKLRSMDELK